jgi:MFS family permease
MSDDAARPVTSWTSHLRKRLASSPRYRWYVVGMLWWISFFNYADRQAIFSVFPLLAVQMHLSKQEQGILGTAFAWVYGLCAPFAGLVVDRVLRRTAILGGLYVWSAICLATAVSRKFWHLVLFRAAEGVGETFYYPASMSMLSDYHGRHTRSTALGLHQTSVYAGTIGGGFFAGLIGQHYGWQSSFVVFGAMGIILGLVLQHYLVEPRRGAAENGSTAAATEQSQRLSLKQTLRLIMMTPTVLCLMLAFMAAMFVNMVLLAWMPSFLYDRFHLSLARAGFDATFYPQLASMIGASLGGWWADSWRRRLTSARILVQATGVLCGAPFVYLCGQAESGSVVLVFLAGWGLCKGFYDANIFAAVFEVVPPAARGSVAGFMNMTGWLGGGALAPILIGHLAQHYGFAFAISSAGSIYVLSAGLLVLAAVAFLQRDLTNLHSRSEPSLSTS